MTVHSSVSLRASLNGILLATLAAAPLSVGHLARAEDSADATPAVAADDNANTKAWQNFCHFTLIANTDLSIRAADALNADSVSGDQLLGAIEASQTRYQEVEKILAIAVLLDKLKPSAMVLSQKIQAARIAHAQDGARIVSDIARLGDGSRPYANAVERLKASGQYAVPFYLATLQDQTKSRLHPHVLAAMAEVGAPLAYPLAVALPHLDASTAERVADILGRIHHPVALPYLKQAIEGKEIREVTRGIFVSTFKEISTRTSLSETAPASALFTRLSESIYQSGTAQSGNPTPIMSGMVTGGKGLIWQYVEGNGLTPIAVPEVALADDLALQMAETALTLDPHNTTALTLHLAANLRRENRLNGTADPAYPATRPNPAFNLLLAGPDQQQAVLIRALDANDSALALDAIEAMDKTIDDFNFEGNRQPLIECLSYGDARVRYSAALALANAAPKSEFPGSSSVVPILAQIIRAGAEPNALVISTDNQVGAVTAALEKSGFKQALGGRTLAEAKTISAPVLPSLDLIVYTGSVQGFNNMMAGVRANGLYRTIPVLALVDAQSAAAIHVAYPGDMRITTADIKLVGMPEDLTKATTLAVQNYRGAGLDAKAVDAYAAAAMSQLKEIASTPSVYAASDARMALETALSDTRPNVAVGAATVLEKFNRADSQNALLKAALAAAGEVQEAQLNSAAKSFEAFGNKADPDIFKQLIDLLKSSPTAGAARAVGAGRPSPDLAVGAIIPQAAK